MGSNKTKPHKASATKHKTPSPPHVRAFNMLTTVTATTALALAAALAAQYALTSTKATQLNPQQKPMPPSARRAAKAADAKYQAHEFASISRNLTVCLDEQTVLMTMPVTWPGFYSFCIASIADERLALRVHGADEPWEVPVGANEDAVMALTAALKERYAASEMQLNDNMISTSDYDYPPNPWKLFTQAGGPVESAADLAAVGVGGQLWLYTGGQFIWPGVRIGHKTRVPIPLEGGAEKVVVMTTVALRPAAFVLSGFLSDDECDYVRNYASKRMVRSGLATMDSTATEDGVRTSTQTFMERGGSAQIRALEERAHNLTRLPYPLGENIQVLRYTEGQKYGAHRDFFSPNDYHKQPQMLKHVEYGARNRLATVFWYLETVAEGGETFFPRALNESGVEYMPWNGDHEDCYRGIAIKPVRGNAVLFYSIVPDGRLDERALHGGCKPRGASTEKWGANQWIWNHPDRRERKRGEAPPRRGAKKAAARRRADGTMCTDLSGDCAAWAASGECTKNAAYMNSNCAASCDSC